jgi:hypothetical protein
MAAAPVNYAWVPAATVTNGGYFRFAVLAPAAWTAAQTQTYLETLGWNVKSIGVPPADVQAALNAAGIVFPGGNVPQGFWVIGTWLGGPGTLPPDPQIVYEQLASYQVVPAGTPNESTDPVPDQFPPATSASSDVAITVLGLGAIAFLGYLVWKESKGINYASHRGMHANPIAQTITVPVNGRKVPFLVEDLGTKWAAAATIKLGRKKALIVGSGSTKSEALHDAIRLASGVFASADV